MPTYSYECKNCGQFDEWQKISADAYKKCPKCGGNEIRRLIGRNVAVIFKGNGFYSTDYGRTSKVAGSGSSSNSSGSSESKPATTTQTPPPIDLWT